MTVLEIDGGYGGLRFSACHFIPRHEKCSRLHGHSYIVRLRLEGDIGPEGMVMDFVVLKRKLKEMIEFFDHAVLLPGTSDIVRLTENGDQMDVECLGRRYSFPRSDVRVLDVPTTTAEEMSRMMAERLVGEIDIPANVRTLAVGLDEERGQTAWYTVVLRG